jgi:diguanylate cyclase (GGDEF)-like protein/PAS domain S-box-containing protein
VDKLEVSGISIEAATSAAGIGVVVTDAREMDWPIVYVNKAFVLHTGYEAAEVLGRNCRFLQGDLTDTRAVDTLRRALIAGQSSRTTLLNYRKDGTKFWNELTIDPIRDSNGEISHFISFQRDASADRLAVEARLEAEKHLVNVTENIPGYIFRRIMHADKTITHPFLSRSLFRILGMPEDTDWSSKERAQFIHPDDRDAFHESLIQSGLSMLPLHSEFRILAASGREFWFRSDSTPRQTSDGCVVWEGLAVDVTAEKVSESKLIYLARHDSLTGLANRHVFRNAVIDAVATGLPAVNDALLFYIDLDGFQVLNQELGQAFGDLVLQDVGHRLLAFATSRGGIAARLGGDEFALLLTPNHASVGAPAISQEILAELSRTRNIGGRDISTEVCIGVVVHLDDDTRSCSPDERAGELLKRADLALRRAKQDGAGSCRLYSAQIDDRVQNRMALRRSLHDGLNNEQFQLHYQPFVDLRTGSIVGAEALLRWNHPELGIQRPDLFIPYAETSGLIVPLGSWVMKQAMRQSQSWRAQGMATPRIAINVSGVQLQRPGFVSMVEQALAETGASAGDFDLELTEGTLIGATGDIRKQLDGLRKLGFGLALDDFGTGHATLKSLRDFPVNKIKIDQIFVRQLVVDSDDASIIRAVIALSRSLRLDVVAEGIETIMQRDFLVEEGCKVGQGYLMSLPLAAEDFGWLLAGHHILHPTETAGPQDGPRET